MFVTETATRARKYTMSVDTAGLVAKMESELVTGVLGIYTH
jgi:hypothetical protein